MMEKETVTMLDFEAAFKALDEIDIPSVSNRGRCIANRVNLAERFNAKTAHEVLVEDYFDINNPEELDAAKEEREAEVAKAKLARIEKIVDLDAETEEDILPSYVGKVIMQCPQCMTLFYKNEEDIETSEETPEVVNINEVCQHCGNASGYTLIGKVGGIEADEAENFDMDEIDVDENELNLDFPEEGTEEVDAEGTGEIGDAMEDAEAEELDLDLDFDLEDDEEEEEEEVEESLHNSNLLKDIEDKNDLKSEEESEHLTLNEDIEEPASEEIEESLHNSEALADAEKESDLKSDIESENLTLNEDAEKQTVAGEEVTEEPQAQNEEEAEKTVDEKPVEEGIGDWYRKTFDKPASTATQQAWEDELNGEMGEISDKRRAELEKKFAQQRDWEDRHITPDETPIDEKEPVGVANEDFNEDAYDKLFDELWSGKQPTDTETQAILDGPVFEEAFEEAEDLDEESINKHLTEYFTSVYSNVSNFEATGCNMNKNKLVLEGKIKFNSGKEKATKFVFESTDRGIVGINEDFATHEAFRLSAKVKNKTLMTESFKYCYKIEGSLVKGTTKN